MSSFGPHIAAAPSQESSRLTELLVMTEKELFNSKSLLEAKVKEALTSSIIQALYHIWISIHYSNIIHGRIMK